MTITTKKFTQRTLSQKGKCFVRYLVVKYHAKLWNKNLFPPLCDLCTFVFLV